MNAFQKALEVERRSRAELVPWLQEDAGYILQKLGTYDERGDYIAYRDGTVLRIDLKAEQKFTGNIFVESRSNAGSGRLGWLWHLKQCDRVLYHFLDTGDVYSLDLPRLRNFIVSSNAYREVRTIAAQDNVTLGFLVPIRDLKDAGIILGQYVVPEGMAAFKKQSKALAQSNVD